MSDKALAIVLFWTGIIATVVGVLGQDVGAAFTGGYCICFGTHIYFEEKE